ncbi:hypothetical protein [Isobaculum melis]|uniref:Uncharacterized protein n=1 Tax=Isobaculum melis TaxID=142588 RepID=A0A1H9T8A5_9LACT|nr:hypothetical protein [Isobaculum melis]SER93475.1 hypothetical protein SAMN04488559_11153 [Isobaculum melis]
MEKVEIEEKIAALIAKEITEIHIEKKDFIDFISVWSKHESKNQIVGEAGLGGNVVYRLIENAHENNQ